MAPRYPLDAPFNSLGPCRPAPRLPGNLNRKGRLGALGVPPDTQTKSDYQGSLVTYTFAQFTLGFFSKPTKLSSIHFISLTFLGQ